MNAISLSESERPANILFMIMYIWYLRNKEIWTILYC